jgi:hypothetical protein
MCAKGVAARLGVTAADILRPWIVSAMVVAARFGVTATAALRPRFQRATAIAGRCCSIASDRLQSWLRDAKADASRLRSTAPGDLLAMLNVPIFIIALVAAAPALGGYLTTSMLLQTRVAAALPVQSSPPLRPLPPAKPSWVSIEESELQRALGRELLLLSPAELLSMYEHKGSDSVEVYREKWVKIDYPITSITKQTVGTTTFDVIEATAHFQSAFPAQVIAFFSEQKWGARLQRHLPKDQIVAFCKFMAIDPEAVMANLNRLRFYGASCDLPQQG